MNASNVRKVASWEFHKAVRSPVFLVMTVVVPLIMLVSAGASYLLQSAGEAQQLDVAVIAESSALFEAMEMGTPASPVSFTQLEVSREEVEAAVLAGEYDGFLILNEAAILAGSVEYYVKDVRNFGTASLQTNLAPWLTTYRLSQLGLQPEQIEAALRPVRISTGSITGQATDPAGFVAPLIAAVILVMSTILSGQILMYGVIKEKRNRIVEILLSSVSSQDLMVGKVLGYGALSLLQVIIWVGAGLAVAVRFFNMGQLLTSTAGLGASLLFFLLGYLFLASFFATVGATMKDAESGSQAQGLVIMVPMIPLFFGGLLLATPHATWAQIMSHLPPFIPVTMLMRLAVSDVPLWEMATSLIALVISIWLMLRLGARIFEGGILQYDRPLGFKDLRQLLRLR